MEKVFCMIIASGMSKRYGKNKILENIEGKNFLTIIQEKLQKFMVPAIIIYSDIALEDHIFPGNIGIKNDEPKDQIDTIRLGIENIPESTGFMLWPADMPLICEKTIQDMILLIDTHPDRIIAPSLKGSIGHPVFIPGIFYKRVIGEELERGLSTLVHSENILKFPTEDIFTKIGVNTKEEFKRYLHEYKRTFL